MASEIAREFHRISMANAKSKVAERLFQGTKASTPDIRNVRRANPSYYSNPLPDNSSGSKIRPFQCSKDESGRPDAMERVRMNQGHLRGGVLTNYKYARKILNQRARDTTDLQLESEGLPPLPTPSISLTETESRQMELNAILQAIASQINMGRVSELTLNELKNLPRLLIAVLPSMGPDDGVELLQFIDDDIINELRNSQTDVEERLLQYFENVREYVREVIPLLGLDPASAQKGVNILSKDFFGRKIVERDSDRTPQTARAPVAPTVAIDKPPRGLPGGDETLEEATGPKAPILPHRQPPPPLGKIDDRKHVQLNATVLESLRRAYRADDIDALRDFLRTELGLDDTKVALTNKQKGAFNSKVKAKNYIRKRTGEDIRW
jgi:hypothetical protein